MVRNREDIKGMALDRISTLFLEASKEFKKNPERSHRYVKIALRLGAKAGVRIPKEYRRNYCRKCKNYLLTGVNSKVRTRNGNVVISCLICKGHRRIKIT